MGQAPAQSNALARIYTTHLYAPLRTLTHYTQSLCACHLGTVFEPRPLGLFPLSLKFDTSQKSRLVQCQETLVAVHVDATSVFRPWRHCTWEFLNT